jgi:hypothetical protein
MVFDLILGPRRLVHAFPPFGLIYLRHVLGGAMGSVLFHLWVLVTAIGSHDLYDITPLQINDYYYVRALFATYSYSFLSFYYPLFLQWTRDPRFKHRLALCALCPQPSKVPTLWRDGSQKAYGWALWWKPCTGMFSINATCFYFDDVHLCSSWLKYIRSSGSRCRDCWIETIFLVFIWLSVFFSALNAFSSTCS